MKCVLTRSRGGGSTRIPIVALWFCACLEACASEKSPLLMTVADRAVSCEPDSVRMCPCLGADEGIQTCVASGTGFGPCLGCSSATAPNEGAGGVLTGMAGTPLTNGRTATGGSSQSEGDVKFELLEGVSLAPEEPVPGVSCGVGLPVLCEPDAEQCCIRSLATDSCIPVGDSCTCEVPGCEVATARCDGPEDCDGGEVCCGTISGNRYAFFQCSSDCSSSGSQREACHDGDGTCPQGLACANSQLLTNLQICIDPATIQQ